VYELLILAEIMEHTVRPEHTPQESLMTMDELKEFLFFHSCGSGLPPAKIKPGRAFPHDDGTTGWQRRQISHFICPQHWKIFSSDVYVPFFMQEAIIRLRRRDKSLDWEESAC
jgi:hypothetical protein